MNLEFNFLRMACCCLSCGTCGTCQGQCLNTAEYIGRHIDEHEIVTLPHEFCAQKHIFPIQTDVTENPTELANIIKTYSIPHFVHASMMVNICGTPLKSTTSDPKLTPEGWNASDFNACYRISKELQFAHNVGSRGLVLHTGQHCKRHSVEVSMQRMQYSVKKILEGSSLLLSSCKEERKETKLLLETPVGEGTEICARIEELASFYVAIPDAYRTRVQLCMDTCHIFGAGYEPLEYMKLWNNAYPGSIGVVHFNDSVREINSHVDKHALWTGESGKIKIKKMLEIRHWCTGQNIPMITERGIK